MSEDMPGFVARLRRCFAAALIVLGGGVFSSELCPAQQNWTVWTGARLLPIDSAPIDSGTLIVRSGKIVAIGPADEVVLPAGEGVRRIDATGKTIMPGLICTHSHIGGIGGADGSAAIQPDVRIYDSLNVHDSGFKRALAGGLTTLNIMPGSGHLLSGQTLYAKLRGGKTIDDFFILDDRGEPMGGVKMANGTNSIRLKPFPGTRGKSAAMVRGEFIKAQEYRDKIRRADGDPTKLPPRDLRLETLVDILEKRKVVHHHTHRHDDIMTVLRLAKEFDFRVVLHHVSEGWKVADEIAAAKAPCSIILLDSPGGKLEAVNLVMRTGGILERAGVKVAFHTDDWITDSRLFFRMAAFGVRAGMSRASALRALTLSGAEMLELDDRIGSLTAGKDADLIVLDGDPLSVYTKVLETWVEGERVFDRSDPDDRLYAVGGYGAGHDQSPYYCCFDHNQNQGGQ
ncbi:MAG: amidohydrolase family protein [Planctomycetota bacterium]